MMKTKTDHLIRPDRLLKQKRCHNPWRQNKILINITDVKLQHSVKTPRILNISSITLRKNFRFFKPHKITKLQYQVLQLLKCKLQLFLFSLRKTICKHTHKHTHPHLWRRRRTHPHCSSSSVKADQSFRTDVQLLAHVPSGGGPSEFLWREIGLSRSLWSVTTETRQCSFNIQARNVPNSVWQQKNDTGCQTEQICCQVNRLQRWLCVDRSR